MIQIHKSELALKDDIKRSALTVTALLFLAFLTTELLYGNAKGDDAFILFRLVVNFVDHGQLAYNLGEPVYAFTSPLWFGILSAIYSFVGNIYLAAQIASSITLVFAIISVWLLTGSLIRTHWMRVCAVICLLVDHWFMRWSFSGQEISLKIGAVALLLWLFSRHVYQGHSSLSSYLITGFAFTAGVLTRPEIGLLLLLFVLFLLRRKQIRGTLVVAITTGALYSIWAVFCFMHFGEFLPHTILAKTLNLVGGTQIVVALGRLFTYSLPRYCAIVLLPVSCLICVTLILMAKAKSLSINLVKEPTTTALTLFWIIGVSIAYFVIGAFMVSQYTLIFSPFIPIVFIALIEGLSKRIQKPFVHSLVVPSIIFSLLISAGIYAFGFGRYSWLSSSNYELGDDIRYVRMGQWIDQNLPHDSRIATAELGIVGFFGKRHMIDLGGIATPELLLKDKRAVLLRLRPTHFSLYGEKRTNYLGFRLKEIKSVSFRRIGGANAFRADEDTCTLYQVVDRE